MYNMVGFVPSMYVSEVMCENKEKRERSAKHNYERIVYEFAENCGTGRFGEMLDEEIEKLRRPIRYVG